MARTLKLDIPGRDWRRSVDALSEGGWKALFEPELTSPQRFVVEFGFGRGEFLQTLAERNPDSAFLGVEYSRKRVLKLTRRLARSELENLRLLQERGEWVVKQLPECSVDEVWINFSDPWPKKRHARRRLIQAPFVSDLARRLLPGSILHVATDHVPYALQIHALLSKEVLLENLAAPAPWMREISGREPTAYEAEWRAEGRPLHFFEYARGSGSTDASTLRDR